PVRHHPAGGRLQALGELRRQLPAVGLHEPGDHVGAAVTPAMPLGEHRVGLAHPRCGTEIDAELATLHTSSMPHWSPARAAPRSLGLTGVSLTCAAVPPLENTPGRMGSVRKLAPSAWILRGTFSGGIPGPLLIAAQAADVTLAHYERHITWRHRERPAVCRLDDRRLRRADPPGQGGRAL